MLAQQLFHDLEQTQGPFSANVAVGATHVVQTRVQEIRENETAGLVGISCSIMFGQQDLGTTHARYMPCCASPLVFVLLMYVLCNSDLPRRVSVETKGSAALRVQSAEHNASLNIRAGEGSNATISFIRTNDLPNRDHLIVDALSNESIATPESMHTSAVHRFEWAMAGNGTLDLLGSSVRRDDSEGSLLMPTMRDTPVNLLSIQDGGDVGSLSVGGSARFGDAVQGGVGPLFTSMERRIRFAERGASLIGVDVAAVTLTPVDQALCYSANLMDPFCLTGPSVVTPLTGGAVNLDVDLQQAELMVPGGACQSNSGRHCHQCYTA
jgi:hypothetical protein